jgi:hypothetical protein
MMDSSIKTDSVLALLHQSSVSNHPNRDYAIAAAHGRIIGDNRGQTKK